MMGALTIATFIGAVVAVIGYKITGDEFVGFQAIAFFCTATICRAIERTGNRKDHDNERD